MNIYTASLMALIAYGAKGDTAATGENNSGGLFHLTDEKTPDGYRAFVVMRHDIHRIVEGSWTWDDDGVFIKWSTGDIVHYPWDFWKPNMAILRQIGINQHKKDESNE